MEIASCIAILVIAVRFYCWYRKEKHLPKFRQGTILGVVRESERWRILALPSPYLWKKAQKYKVAHSGRGFKKDILMSESELEEVCEKMAHRVSLLPPQKITITKGF